MNNMVESSGLICIFCQLISKKIVVVSDYKNSFGLAHTDDNISYKFSSRLQ